MNNDSKKEGMFMSETDKYVYRYTSFSRLLEIIATQRLALLDPTNGTWKDQIDVGFIKACKKAGKQIGVLCFTKKHATSFHWDLFAKYDGVRIAFKKNVLEKRAKKCCFITDKVSYKISKEIKEKLSDGNGNPLNLETFAFLKRSQYEAEEEWRIVCEKDNSINDHVVAYLPIKISDIESVTFSPYYRDSGERKILRESLKKLWISMGGGKNKLKIYRSTLYENKDIQSLLKNNGRDEVEDVE